MTHTSWCVLSPPVVLNRDVAFTTSHILPAGTVGRLARGTHPSHPGADALRAFLPLVDPDGSPWRRVYWVRLLAVSALEETL